MNEKLQRFLDEHNDVNILMLSKFGSHLYGTNTPDSDEDYKGVYLPSESDMLLCRAKKTFNNKSENEGRKNTADDIDVELYSLQYFLELAKIGDTTAIDLLHSSGESLLMTSDLWDMLRQSRSMFYTKKMKAFAGYAKKQSEKYCIKAEKLKIAKDFVEFLNQYQDNDRLSYFWDKLPITELSYHLQPNSNGVNQYMICSKILQSTMSVKYAREILNILIAEFGVRVKRTESNNGIDWKAVSHALRACCEVKEIYETGDLQFPLKDHDFLFKVKKGELEFKSVNPILEELVEEINQLSENSKYPEEVNKEKVDSFALFLIKVMG